MTADKEILDLADRYPKVVERLPPLYSAIITELRTHANTNTTQAAKPPKTPGGRRPKSKK